MYDQSTNSKLPSSQELDALSVIGPSRIAEKQSQFLQVLYYLAL